MSNIMPAEMMVLVCRKLDVIYVCVCIQTYMYTHIYSTHIKNL